MADMMLVEKRGLSEAELIFENLTVDVESVKLINFKVGTFLKYVTIFSRLWIVIISLSDTLKIC